MSATPKMSRKVKALRRQLRTARQVLREKTSTKNDLESQIEVMRCGERQVAPEVNILRAAACHRRQSSCDGDEQLSPSAREIHHLEQLLHLAVYDAFCGRDTAKRGAHVHMKVVLRRIR